MEDHGYKPRYKAACFDRHKKEYFMSGCTLSYVFFLHPFFKKYCHTYEFPHTYGSIFFRMPAFLSGKLFYSCRLLGLMQTIHASAVRCCFCRIKCHFSQNCCCNIFLFAACHIAHLHFILIASIAYFADFSPSMLKFRHSM